MPFSESRKVSQTFLQKRQQAAQQFGIDPNDIPRHIAIIMDGNGRWAKERDLPRFHGHSKGAQCVEKIALYCVKIGVEYLTLYSFSMQNWKRPSDEITFLMQLYVTYLQGIRKVLMKNNVRLVHIGQTERLPDEVVKEMNKTIEITGDNDGMVLALALNYGARTEITDAVKKIARQCVAGQLAPDDIDQARIADNLYTADLPDPDLLIRTSGEMRISNFLLWQISYAEFYVTDVYWPDFSTDKLDLAIKTYAERSRRFGDATSQTTS